MTKMEPKIIRYSMLFIYIICLSVLSISCSKEEEENQVPKPPGSNQTSQYGTPFSEIPETSDIIMYEINERAFSASGDFTGITERLDSIEALGINVIWLMPVHPIGEVNSVNSPYCVKDYFGVNPEYGNLSDLRELVQEAHDRGMAVILDWVANHTSWDNDWLYNESWYTQDNNGDIIHPAGTNWEDVADLNYDNSEMRLEMIEAMKYWILMANVDGFRCDAADFVPSSFWSQAIDSLQNIPGREIILLAEGAQSSHFNSGFQMTFGWDFYNKNINVFMNSQPATGLYQTHQSVYNSIPEGKHRLRFTSNHDKCAWENTPLVLFGGKEASIAAFVVTAYMGGVPLVYNGQEVGCPLMLPIFSNSQIDWSINADIFHEYKKILSLRNSNEALRSGALEDFSDNDIVAFTRESSGSEVFVLVNTRNETNTFELPADFQNTTWQDAINSTSVTFNDTISLNAYEYFVFTE
jgi:glycosidase